MNVKIYECGAFGECTMGRSHFGNPACGPGCDRFEIKESRLQSIATAQMPSQVVEELPEWSFITNEMHARDAINLIKYIPPECAGIVGVARSGLFAATAIATTLNLPLWELSGQHKLRPLGSGSRTNGITRRKGPLFVIDDSAYSGRAIQNAKKSLTGIDAIFAVVYCKPEAKRNVDFYSKLLPSPHLFAWNLLNNGIVHGNASDPRLRGGIGFDFDGVLCEECPVDDQNHKAYRNWILQAKPKSIPRLTDVLLIATARIPRYENETRNWLSRWNIRPRRLALYPADTNNRTYEQVAKHKANSAIESKVSIFIESSSVQSKLINQQIKIPVICTDNGIVYR